MQPNDLEFSPRELELLTDQEILPLKKHILDKLERLLDLLHTNLRSEVRSHANKLPEYLVLHPGKLTRGENYQSFSFRILDYPAFFQKTEWLFFRTVIMWGHHMGFHFMAKGEPLEAIMPILLEELSLSPVSGLKVNTHHDPWKWIPDEEDHEELQKVQKGDVIRIVDETGFLKISYYLPLYAYKQLPEKGVELWRIWQEILIKKYTL